MPDARIVIEQLPAWPTHSNEMYAHEALDYASGDRHVIIFGLVSAGLPAGPIAPSGMNTATAAPCVARQLSLSVDGKDGRFSGMQKSGTELSIRNHGPDCAMPALPRIEFLDARVLVLPVSRAVPIGMHPGPVMIPVRLAGGHRAASDLIWVSGPVYAQNRSLRVAYVRVTIGRASLRTRLAGVVDAQPGRAATFDQPPLRAMEGMAAD